MNLLRRPSRTRPTRIFFASDVHGSEQCFRKWLNAARVYDAQVLVMGGDITGKIIVPLVGNGDGLWRGEIFEEPVEIAPFRRRVEINDDEVRGFALQRADGAVGAVDRRHLVSEFAQQPISGGLRGFVTVAGENDGPSRGGFLCGHGRPSVIGAGVACVPLKG